MKTLSKIKLALTGFLLCVIIFVVSYEHNFYQQDSIIYIEDTPNSKQQINVETFSRMVKPFSYFEAHYELDLHLVKDSSSQKNVVKVVLFPNRSWIKQEAKLNKGTYKQIEYGLKMAIYHARLCNKALENKLSISKTESTKRFEAHVKQFYAMHDEYTFLVLQKKGIQKSKFEASIDSLLNTIPAQ